METERLTLRPITEDDVDLLVALDADPAVMRFINGGRPSTRAEVEEKVLAAIGHRWVAFDRAIRSMERFGKHGPVARWRTSW